MPASSSTSLQLFDKNHFSPHAPRREDLLQPLFVGEFVSAKEGCANHCVALPLWEALKLLFHEALGLHSEASLHYVDVELLVPGVGSEEGGFGTASPAAAAAVGGGGCDVDGPVAETFEERENY